MNKTRSADDPPAARPAPLTAAEASLSARPGHSLADAYEEAYQATVAIVDGLSERELSAVVPACPAWTVRDLIAHMTGTAADAVGGRFPPVNPHGPWAERQPIIDAFTAGQVTSRQHMGLAEVLAEWARYVPMLGRMQRGYEPFPAGSIPIIGWMVVCDIAAHNHDLRGAIDLPGDRESAAVALSIERYVAGLSQRVAAAGLPALVVRTEHSEYVAGHGPPVSTVVTSRWELFRALSSRRSLSQIRAYTWSGDAEVYPGLFGAYGLPNSDLIE